MLLKKKKKKKNDPGENQSGLKPFSFSKTACVQDFFFDAL